MAITVAFTDDWETDVLKYLLTTDVVSPPAGLYLALFTASPGDTGAATNEMTAGDASNGYARQNVASVLQLSSQVVSFSSAVEFPSATGNWSAPVTHWGICESGTRGTADVIVYGDFDTSRTINSGDQFIATDITVNLVAGTMFNNGQDLALKWVFSAASGITAGTRPTNWYASAWTSDPGDDESGSEVSGGSYARAQFTGGTALSVAGSTASMAGDLDFTTATASWGTVSHRGVHSAVSGTGNGLFHGALDTPKAVSLGDTLRLLSSSSDITLS